MIQKIQESVDLGFKGVHSFLKNLTKTKETTKNHLAYHKSVVMEKFKHIPCRFIAHVIALDTSLTEVSLSVSLVWLIKRSYTRVCSYFKNNFQVCYLANEFRSCRSDADFIHNVYWRLIAHESSQDMQWRADGRKGDNRQGLSCFLNIVAVIGGKLKTSLQSTFFF